MFRRTPAIGYLFIFLIEIFVASDCLAASQTTADFPTFGLKLAVPADAVKMPPTSEGQIVFYQFENDSVGPAIEVEVVPSKLGITAPQACKRYADSEHATVETSTQQIDGEPSAMFHAPMTQPYTTRTTYVVVHGSRTYLFSGLDTVGGSASTPLAAMLSHVIFEPPQAPSNHLSPAESGPIDILGLFTISAPRSMRPTDKADKSVHFGIYDYTSDTQLKNPLNLDIQHIQTANPVSFIDIKDSYSSGLKKQLKTSTAFIWRQEPGVPGLWVSQPLKGVIEQPKGPATPIFNRFCMLELAHGDFVQILFTFAEMPPAEMTTYTTLSDQMLNSIKIAPTTQPSK